MSARRKLVFEGGNKEEPSLLPAIVEPHEYSSNPRENAIIKNRIEAEKQQKIINGGGTEKHTIPQFHTGIKPSLMARAASDGAAASTLQTQENGKYDNFDPNKPVPFKQTAGKRQRKKRKKSRKVKKSKRKMSKTQRKKHYKRKTNKRRSRK